MADNIVLRSKKHTVTVSSLGTGETILSFVSGGSEILIKTIEGKGLDVYTSANNTIIVSSFSITSASSVGGGISLIAGISGSRELLLRTFSPSSDVSIIVSGNNISFQTRNAQVSAITGDISEPLLYTIATAKSSSYLSVETFNFVLGRTGSYGVDSIILTNGITSNVARIPVPYNCRIIRAAGSITANTTSVKNVSILVENTEYTNILTFPVTSTRYYSFNTNVDILVSAGQGITTIVRGGGGNISNAIIYLWMKIQIPN